MSPEGETACSENAFVVDVVAVTAPEVPGEDERETPVAIVNHATNSQKVWDCHEGQLLLRKVLFTL